ncbi:TetR/AcrR family transcriptional regulator [Azospirillum sp. RWY-5-1]|uniref:TetR/AcrR family transcriptional regulator n=1 Tax=Azospirillum oleiclasticum TaxID=2735135 RepID=A0ABX2T6Q8_9PROT|nr:TetR/AcrR family transcriptional regulator [Azospirillum oleiclasticum]NYZ12724.1 TetR/AcrR family transcriptional regulator [Azospirillum oleiclasticum]NYZ19884.1 TetR/AcrR family transcriptional regulator [Azospirillum oleiclasticum]
MAAIREAGLALIHAHGYEAMSLRELAREVGLTAGALYNHIDNKQTLLFDLIDEHMDQVLAHLEEALAVDADPRGRMADFVRFHLLYHIDHRLEVFIGHSELRSLTPENRDVILAKRRLYEDRVTAVIEDGVRGGLFAVADSRVAAYGILAMLTGVCTWFDPRGRLDADAVIRIYTDMVLKGLAAPSRP